MLNKIGFPRMGLYSKIIAKLFDELGTEVILASPYNERAFKIAVSNSPLMMCLPFKWTLADYIDILEKSNSKITLLQYKTCAGRCRFHCYYLTQTEILKKLGYKFNGISPVRSGLGSLWDVMDITGANILEVLFAFKRAYKRIKTLEEELYPKTGDIKIGLIGEIYTICDERSNLNLIQKLKNLGCYVENSLGLAHFINDGFKMLFSRKRRLLRQRAKKIFPELMGGHAINSIENTISFKDKGFDGIILVRPLSCCPEVFVETIINSLVEEYKMPLFIHDCDEMGSEINLENRIESYIESIRLRRCQE